MVLVKVIAKGQSYKYNPTIKSGLKIYEWHKCIIVIDMIDRKK